MAFGQGAAVPQRQYTQHIEQYKSYPVPVVLKNHLVRNQMVLADHITDRLPLILSDLVAKGALIPFLKQSIMAERTDFERVVKLVQVVSTSSVHDYLRFLETLEAAKITHLQPFFNEVIDQDYPLEGGPVLSLR